MKIEKRYNRIGIQDKGILIREIIRKSETSVISRKKYIMFDEADIKEYKHKMFELCQNEILDKNCQYEDNVWRGFNIYWNKYFDFEDFEYNSKLYNALKCFVITELYDRRISISVVASRLSEIKKTISFTKSYSATYMKDFTKYIENKSHESLSDFKFGNTAFLYYYPINGYKEYLHELSYIKSKHILGENVRVLPPYKSVVWFDYIVQDFMNSSSLQMKKKYFPVYLWWRLTSVIPMRPSEFLRLKTKSCYKQGEEYYLEVFRGKRPPNPLSKRRVIPIVTKLKVSEEIFNLIASYIDLADIKNEEYLFPLKFFSEIFHSYNYLHELHTLKDRITYHDFCQWLDNFYQEIVSKGYGFNVVNSREEVSADNQHNTIAKLKLGDTRHLAFCSMMLQAFNPLTIAQIGGHETLYSQSHYFAHLDEFTEAYSLMLSKYIETSINNSSNLNDLFTSNEKRQLTFKHFEGIPQRKIDEGLCYSKSFPKQCVDEDCLFCDWFQFDFEKLDKSTYYELNEKLDKIKNEVKTKLGFLKKFYKNICKDGSIDLAGLSCNDHVQSELTKQVKSINILVNQQASLVAYINKINEV